MDARFASLADQLLLIERELRVQGWWDEVSPSPESLSSASVPLYSVVSASGELSACSRLVKAIRPTLARLAASITLRCWAMR